MQRRSMLLSSAFGASALAGSAWLTGCAATLRAVVPGAPPTPFAPPASSSRDNLAVDAADLAFINRITWGADSASVRAWNRLGKHDFLQAQLHPDASAPLPAVVQAQIDSLALLRKPMTAWVNEMDERRRSFNAGPSEAAKKAAQQAYQQDLTHLARDAGARMLLHALYSPNQLQEQLTWFWFNHFNVHQYKANLRAMVGDYEATLRTRSLGKFRDLLVASASHPAMIRYLDNEQNAAGRLNENFAREVMELHTLGVDAGYSQKDVQELARVLTGLGVNFSDKPPNIKPALQSQYVKQGATEFNPARHDYGEKTVLGTTIGGGNKGSSGNGWNEIVEQLTRLARHPATAQHVSHKLAVAFVADVPPPAIVERMTRAFTASDGEIAVVMQTMFDAPEFSASLGRKFKDPVHYVVSAVRLAYDGRAILNTAPMFGWLNRLGEGLYNRQTPDGYPLDQAAWSSSGQMGTRFEMARIIGSGPAGLFRVEVPIGMAASTAAPPAGSASTTAATSATSATPATPGSLAPMAPTPTITSAQSPASTPAPTERPAFPQLSNALFHASIAPTLSERTRVALDRATSPTEWNVLLLSSPEFMVR